jgi:hypothetical protein
VVIKANFSFFNLLNAMNIEVSLSLFKLCDISY